MEYFKLECAYQDEKKIPLSKNGGAPDNTYTLITGRNASGKSRLLRKIVSHYIFHDRHNIFSSSEVATEVCSLTLPSKVIAISTGATDKFPYTQSKKTKVPYHYVGGSFRGLGAPRPTSTLSNSFLQVIKQRAENTLSSIKLSSIFGALGYLPVLTINIQSPHSLTFSYRNQKEITSERFEQAKKLAGVYTFYLDEAEKNPSKLNLISDLIEQGILRIRGVDLYRESDKNKVSISDTSSGQHCMLQIFIGIAASLKNNSLICIDEPEISLHPEWQLNFINTLQQLFWSYQGCHFIIATHSPQIVSGLKTKNGLVVNLEDSIDYLPEFYSERSADFQLAEIFGSPGYKNEFLIRESLSLLTKIANEERFKDKDRSSLETLKSLHPKLTKNDPVKILIDQILALV